LAAATLLAALSSAMHCNQLAVATLTLSMAATYVRRATARISCVIVRAA